ncbi:fructuronate reductase [Brenneria sp. g21c3]|uniref:mannitol dehydrogenase family protein n=1 Tax=Brenneria sp. g21c3 TaxID=3093893 RepID=UPI002EBFF407|nr:fructuronate reductase [Brenneria sp. g21c3]
MNLSQRNLRHVSPATIIPKYDRGVLRTRIVHLGFGAFHRAHQAVYADRLAADHGSDWGYCEVNLIGGERQIADLQQQDLLYSVCEMNGDDWRGRIVGVIRQALHGEADGIAKVLAAMTQPEIAIVSLTVTEKGYCYLPSTASIDANHPLIQHDLAHPGQPRSAPGAIVEALRLRREKGLKPFSVMSCDNMPNNGRVTRNVVLALAYAQDEELAAWIADNVSFPSTMVDRIVPAVTPDALAKISQAIGGIQDRVGIACEPFSQWVIEDNFIAGRPAWENVGAELVADVLPYEEMKLRMLNGSHSFLAYLGYLAGYQYIDECMQDTDYVQAARQLMLDEQAVTLHVENVDLAAYAESLLTRYRNTGLKHRTWQIAMDGTLKLPQRMLDSIRVHLAQGTPFNLLALGVAGWMRYVGGVDDGGKNIEISDPLQDALAQLVAQSADGQDRVEALLSLRNVFGDDLADNASFVQQVSAAYALLQRYGAKKSVGLVLEKINKG